MTPSEKFYNLAAKTFQYEPVKKVKNKIRPLKHALVGKTGIYKAIDIATALEKAKGREVLTAFDIGAADGEYSLHFLEKFSKAKVYSFEPMKESYGILEKKVSRFGDRSIRNRIGFFNSAGTPTLHLTSHRDASSLLDISDTLKNAGLKEVSSEQISVVRLDDFVEREKIERIEFLKIDVEGVEKEVLEGGMNTLAHKVDNIFIEISLDRKGRYSSNYIEVLSMINKAGFALLDISENENFFFSKLA